MRIAIADAGAVLYELIESLGGLNVYEEFLAEHGEGVHHLGFLVDSIDDTIGEMSGRGYRVLQSGRGFGVNGDGAYAYFDTHAALGFIVEGIELPAEPPEPERTFPG